jgi:hypothetical protein
MVQNIVIQTETGSATNTSGECLGNWEQKSLQRLLIHHPNTAKLCNLGLFFTGQPCEGTGSPPKLC